MHELVSKTKYARFHGTALSDDTCETPSTMLENFCYLDPVIRKLACHYATLKPQYLDSWRRDNPDAGPHAQPPNEVPEDVVEAILEMRRESRLNQYVIQTYVANPAIVSNMSRFVGSIG
jgi:metallopeptidase MepB